VLRLPGDRANQARTQLQALAQALHHILATSTSSSISDGEREGSADGDRGGRGRALDGGGKVWARGALLTLRSEDRSASWRVALARAGKVEPLTRGCVCWHGRWGPGGVASGSGGEAPDPGSPRGEGSKRARTTTSTSTSTSPGDTGCPARPLITARHASRTAVLSSPELLEHVLSFLAGGKEEARKDLGRAALVCRSWREAVGGETLRGRVASEVVPGVRRRVSAVGTRRCVLERGHCIRDQRAWTGETWGAHLRLQVEVWDYSNECTLFSAEGDTGPTDHPHELRLEGADRWEVVGPAFSAASRDPVQRRFASTDDYFRRGPGNTVKKAFWVRVYVRDKPTGRKALLWATQSVASKFDCVDVPPDNPFRPHLPQGSRRRVQAENLPTYSLTPGQALYAPVWSFLFGPRRARRGWGRRTRCGGWRGATRTSTATTPRSFAWRSTGT
jgi:hypothetical protein